MIVKKENEVEIWNNEAEKGESKKILLKTIVLFILFCIAMYTAKAQDLLMGFENAVMVVGIMCFILMTFICLVIKEDEDKKTIIKINKEYLEIINKKNKKIEMNKIQKINNIVGRAGSFLVILYEEDNKIKKFPIRLSSENKSEFEKAIIKFDRENKIERNFIKIY